MNGNETFEKLLAQVRNTTLEAYNHQDLPFEQLIEHLGVERRLNQNPLFQVMLLLRNNDDKPFELNGLTIEPVSNEYPVAKFDLTLDVIENTEGKLLITFEYATDLFKAETIERLSSHFKILLQGIVANPQQRVADLPLLTAAERKQLIVDWNQTQAEYPREKPIHQLFEEQVKKTPHDVALLCDNYQLTYQELNQRANRLAHYLRDQGVKPDSLVAISCERSAELMIGLLGILKAGAPTCHWTLTIPSID